MNDKYLAARIVDALMLAYDHKPVTRLVLMRSKQTATAEYEQNMGGWCRTAAIDRVLAVLLQVQQPNKG